MKNYRVLFLLLLIILFTLIYGITADSEHAAYFLNGAMGLGLDPLALLVVVPFSLIIRRDIILLPSLAVIALVLMVVSFKVGDASTELALLLGKFIGVLTVGYIINALAVFKRNRLKPSTE